MTRLVFRVGFAPLFRKGLLEWDLLTDQTQHTWACTRAHVANLSLLDLACWYTNYLTAWLTIAHRSWLLARSSDVSQFFSAALQPTDYHGLPGVL